MKRKVKRIAPRKLRFDSTEFILLVVVVVGLLVYFAWQNGLLPDFLSPTVLGLATSR